MTHSDETSRKWLKIIFQICWFSKFMLKFSAPKWCITCHSCSMCHRWKINFTVKNSFVFYWLMRCLLACILKSVLATYGWFCGSGSQIVTSLLKLKNWTLIICFAVQIQCRFSRRCSPRLFTAPVPGTWVSALSGSATGDLRPSEYSHDVTLPVRSQTLITYWLAWFEPVL